MNTRVEKLEKSSSAWAKKEKKVERRKITKADVGGELLIFHLILITTQYKVMLRSYEKALSLMFATKKDV